MLFYQDSRDGLWPASLSVLGQALPELDADYKEVSLFPPTILYACLCQRQAECVPKHENPAQMIPLEMGYLLTS